MDSSMLNEAPRPNPIGYFLTWTTYGTWLPGDDRGWVEYQNGWQVADEFLRSWAKAKMGEDACLLTPQQRELVEDTIRKHCLIRNWGLLAVNCRSNHIHVVIASDRSPNVIISQLKARCTLQLKEQQISEGVNSKNVRTNWWTERGSRRYLNDPQSLEAAVRYTLEAQDHVIKH